jgi:hypothetical protein
MRCGPFVNDVEVGTGGLQVFAARLSLGSGARKGEDCDMTII